jgi:hypothetical protein
LTWDASVENLRQFQAQPASHLADQGEWEYGGLVDLAECCFEIKHGRGIRPGREKRFAF